VKSIIVLNAGSSSLKFALFPAEVQGGSDPDVPLVTGQVDGLGAHPMLTLKSADSKSQTPLAIDHLSLEDQHRSALEAVLMALREGRPSLKIVAAGHRIVHGGQVYSAPIRIDADTLETLRRFTPLAPLHQPHNLRGIKVLEELIPGLPQVGCFDTAFHRTQPEIAQQFAIPRDLTENGVRRYGFHGLSYDYISRKLESVLGERAKGAVIICHLGSGSSACALREGKSVASTMGFTALDGLMMGTRTGNIDPGVLLYLMQVKGMDAKAIETLLYKQSGLLGVSGLSQDMRTLLDSDQPQAQEAVALYSYRLVREIGSLMAAAGGFDALVFTGGIGENAAQIRAQVVAGLKWAGVHLNEDNNANNATRIEAQWARIPVAVIPTNEEAMIARYTRERIA